MGVVDTAGGPLRFVLFLVVGLLLFAVIAAASLWGMDYGVQATVVDKDCSPVGQSTVSVQERFTRFVHTQPIDFDQCGLVQPGNFAIYNIRSERLQIYTEEGGTKIWDSRWL